MLNKTLGLLTSAAMVMGASQMASAADLAPRYTKAPVPVEVWNWTGFYIGGHVGAGWGTTETTLDSIAAPGVPVAPLRTAGAAFLAADRSDIISSRAGLSLVSRPTSQDLM